MNPPKMSTHVCTMRWHRPQLPMDTFATLKQHLWHKPRITATPRSSVCNKTHTSLKHVERTRAISEICKQSVAALISTIQTRQPWIRLAGTLSPLFLGYHILLPSTLLSFTPPSLQFDTLPTTMTMAMTVTSKLWGRWGRRTRSKRGW
jgi:hypothetical protein